MAVAITRWSCRTIGRVAVTPSKTGYTFTATHLDFTNVAASQLGQNFLASLIIYTISGNAGTTGVTISYGTDSSTVVDGIGDYTFNVPYDWTGTATPSKTGYTFSPTHIDYANVLANQTSQNYAVVSLTISGNAGVAGATMTFGTDSTATADGSGNHSLVVPYDWTGTVTPSMTGYTFNPTHLDFANVVASQTGQNFALASVTISGNAGVAGATLTFGTDSTAIADGSGDYSLVVPYDWTGAVTPSLDGYTFSPTHRDYANVVLNQLAQNYGLGNLTISGNAGIAGATLTFGTDSTTISDGSGNYSLIVPYDWTGTITPSLTGYTFNPTHLDFTNVVLAQSGQNFALATVTISGSAGIAAATIAFGTDSTVIADGSGNYSLVVPYDWTGTITPSLTGYTFNPTHLDFANVVFSQTGQDFVIASLTISGNAGAPDVTLTFGTDSTTTSDGSGDYSAVVPYDWTGTITPSKTGYTFNPTHLDFANVVLNQMGQDFGLASLTISGSAGVAGAALAYGTDSTTTADGSGNYSLAVPYGWTGTVTPGKTGFTFTPTQRAYTNVQVSQNNVDSNFVATAITYTISGSAGVAGATLSYDDGGPLTATSQADSTYSFTVSYNWSGTVTPTKTGYTFAPASRTYANVLSDQTAPDSDYVATPITYTISGHAGLPDVVLSWTDGTAKADTVGTDSLYSFTVCYNWSGIVTPSLDGFTFTPDSRAYTNVLAHQTGQDYSPSLVLDVERDLSAGIPKEYQLLQNYPNPFNPSTAIRFDVPKTSSVNLKIYNVIGQEVATLLSRELPAGAFKVYWNGTDKTGKDVSSGVYFYRITAGDFVDTRKMILMK